MYRFSPCLAQQFFHPYDIILLDFCVNDFLNNFQSRILLQSDTDLSDTEEQQPQIVPRRKTQPFDGDVVRVEDVGLLCQTVTETVTRQLTQFYQQQHDASND